jgi:DNA-binding helix-turn-helix protein
MGSPKIKDLREELGISLEDLAIKLRIPKMTLYRIENGLEIPPSYFMRSIYVQLVDEVEQKRFEEENPKNDFLDKLLNGTLNEDNKKDEKYNEALEATITEMLDDSIDNIGKNKKNNFEDEEIYITPSKSEIDKFYKKAFADLEEKVKNKLEDND